MDKYKINDLLDNLTVKEYKFVIKNIPGIIGVTVNTWHNYRHIKMGDRTDIPYKKVRLIELLFGLKPGELTNEKFEQVGIKELFHSQTSS